MSSTLLWGFVGLQLLIDLYLIGVALYWVIQKRRYGTFHPLSAFQHRDILEARDLLLEFKRISQQTALLMEQTQTRQRRLENLERVATPAERPQEVALPVAPSPRPVRGLNDQVRSLLRQGRSITEIRATTGISTEEIQMLKALS